MAARLFAAPRVTAESAADGSVLLRSADPLGEYPATVTHGLRAWADAGPDHPLAAERAEPAPAGVIVADPSAWSRTAK